MQKNADVSRLDLGHALGERADALAARAHRKSVVGGEAGTATTDAIVRSAFTRNFSTSNENCDAIALS